MTQDNLIARQRLAKGLRDTAKWIREASGLATNWLYCDEAADLIERLSPPSLDGEGVIQADRDAAAAIVEWQNGLEPRFFHPDMPAGIREGVWDNHNVVQAFAAHRRAATISTPREDEVERVNGFPATREQWGEMADCPFCKARADEFNISVTYSTGVEDRKNIRSYMSECAECGAMGPTADTEEEALRLWNALASADAVLGEGE